MRSPIILAALVMASCATAQEPTIPPQIPTPPPVVDLRAAEAAATTPPVLDEPKPLTLPAVVERTLANGLRILVVEHHELPVADFIMVVKSGSETDPPRREGLASLTAAL